MPSQIFLSALKRHKKTHFAKKKKKHPRTAATINSIKLNPLFVKGLHGCLSPACCSKRLLHRATNKRSNPGELFLHLLLLLQHLLRLLFLLHLLTQVAYKPRAAEYNAGSRTKQLCRDERAEHRGGSTGLQPSGPSQVPLQRKISEFSKQRQSAARTKTRCPIDKLAGTIQHRKRFNKNSGKSMKLRKVTLHDHNPPPPK